MQPCQFIETLSNEQNRRPFEQSLFLLQSHLVIFPRRPGERGRGGRVPGRGPAGGGRDAGGRREERGQDEGRRDLLGVRAKNRFLLLEHSS